MYIRVSALCQLELDMLAAEDKSLDQDQGEYYLQYLPHIYTIQLTVASTIYTEYLSPLSAVLNGSSI